MYKYIFSYFRQLIKLKPPAYDLSLVNKDYGLYISIKTTPVSNIAIYPNAKYRVRYKYPILNDYVYFTAVAREYHDMHGIVQFGFYVPFKFFYVLINVDHLDVIAEEL